MRHQYAKARLNRTKAHKLALFRNLATALVRHERIKTTLVKAKVLRSFVEKLVTKAKRGDLHARRLAARDIHDHEMLRKLFGELAERYHARSGGYTRLLKLANRSGDNSKIALVELVDRPLTTTPAEKSESDTGKEQAAEGKSS